MKYFAGLDLSMEETSLCVVDEAGSLIHETSVASEPAAVKKALEGHVAERVVIETGRMAPGMVHGLRGLGVPVVCSRVKIENQIRGLAACFGLRLGKGAGRDFARRTQVVTRDVHGLAQAIDALLAVHASLLEAITFLDREMRRAASEREVCARLMAIPGVGVQTALAFTAALDAPERFKRSRDVGAYLGLVPRRHQSGDIAYTGRITKRGDGTVRRLLYETANSILTRFKGTMALKSWALRIAKRAGMKKARIALARRLAVIMHAMMMDGTEFAMA